MHSAVHYVRLRINNLKRKSQYRWCTVSLDFSKAFDRIDRRYIVNLLSAVGIPDKLCALIKHTYDGPESLIEMNSFLSKKIKSNRGVRKGDPFSTLVFVFGLEPLLQHLEKCTEVEKVCTKKALPMQTM